MSRRKNIPDFFKVHFILFLAALERVSLLLFLCTFKHAVRKNKNSHKNVCCGQKVHFLKIVLKNLFF